MIKRRKDLLDIGLSYPSTYQDRPFKDTNWVLIRIKGSKKAFLWIYELDGELIKVLIDVSYTLVSGRDKQK